MDLDFAGLDWDLDLQALAYLEQAEEIVQVVETACHLAGSRLVEGRADRSGGRLEVVHRSAGMEEKAYRDRLVMEASYRALEVVRRGLRMVEAYLAFLCWI